MKFFVGYTINMDGGGKVRETIFFTIIGYLCGSILFAKWLGELLCNTDITANSRDHNPGTANAFMFGGFWCGTITLFCELLKGFLPVFLYLRAVPLSSSHGGLAFVIAAPVAGHIFPVFHHFRGGKGIAVSFGCLMGLFPYALPALILAFVFIFFSVIVVVSPHYYRTFLTYAAAAALMLIYAGDFRIVSGFGLISALVTIKLMLSAEEKGKCRIRLLWKR